MSKKTNLDIGRTPVVSVMGHVDHGKTSLLDVIRGTRVQQSEVGGITQNIRAHQIKHKNQKITFIDTPGHEAFTDMRSRGAKVTDIVLLVVAADDGVQPQTIESIKFAKKSNVPIIVAVNKMDLPGANPDKVKQELSQYDVLVEDYGGDTQIVEVSALKEENIDGLLESILLQAEILELKKSKAAQGKAEAVILESTLDKHQGPTSLIIIKAGETKIQDYVIYPGKYTTVRSLKDEKENDLKIVQEGDPATLIGLDDVLPTGEILFFEDDKSKAEELAETFKESREKEDKISVGEDATDEEKMALLAEMIGDKKDEEEKQFLKVVLKTDSQGTLEAVEDKVSNLGTEEVGVEIISSSTGQITEKDVLRAKNSKGIVLGFQSKLGSNVQNVAKREKVLVRNYEIIYELLEEIEDVIESMLEPEEELIEVARARVKKVFELSDGSIVAGSEVKSGNVVKGYSCFVARGDHEIAEGKIISLRQGKDEVREVKKGMECGIQINTDVDFEKGDEIVCYKIEK